MCSFSLDLRVSDSDRGGGSAADPAFNLIFMYFK